MKSTYSPETLLVIAQALVEQGGHKNNHLMTKPEIRRAVKSIIDAKKKAATKPSLTTN